MLHAEGVELNFAQSHRVARGLGLVCQLVSGFERGAIPPEGTERLPRRDMGVSPALSLRRRITVHGNLP